jgi:hypothetical protein
MDGNITLCVAVGNRSFHSTFSSYNQSICDFLSKQIPCSSGFDENLVLGFAKVSASSNRDGRMRSFCPFQ